MSAMPRGAQGRDLTNAAAHARAVRGRYVLAVATGMLTVDDVIRQAQDASGIPLRRIRLTSLLQAQEGWGRGQARSVIDRLLAFLSNTDTSELPELTIGWLLDNRAGGTRYRAFIEAIATTDPMSAPWSGFPRFPQPGKDLS